MKFNYCKSLDLTCRHTFRRSLIVNAGIDGFQTLFCLLLFLKSYSETRQPFCCSSHEQMFNYIVTIGWNEGIQLLMVNYGNMSGFIINMYSYRNCPLGLPIIVKMSLLLICLISFSINRDYIQLL